MKKIILTFMCVLFFNISSFADFRFGLMLGYSPIYTVDLSGGGVSGGTPYVRNYDLIYKGSPEIGFEVWNLNKNSWGFISGVQISQVREMSEGKINGLNVAPTSTTTKFQTSFAYIGGAYKWESFYIPLALTIGVSTVKPPPGTTADVKTGPGALLGFGYFFSDSVAIEYIGRSALMELKLTNGNTTETTNGAVGSALLNLKFFF